MLKIPEDLLPDGFKLDSTIHIIKKPEPKTKPDMVVPNYSSRKQVRNISEENSYYARTRESNPSAYRPWSPELDEELETMFDAGNTYQEIAVEFERTKGAIISRLKKIGLIQS